MASRKIYLVSPREPSGATWLINCLLELGIKTYRMSGDGMWRNEGADWFLNAHEQPLRKWLPALSDHTQFRFRGDIEVQWMHEWFTDSYANNEILYFVRDPRDALFSRYKREAPAQTYAEFAAFPDVYTLLDKTTNWHLYTATWLTHTHAHLVRFEDYKADAAGTLARALDSLQLRYGDADIERAVNASTFERAVAAERAYRADHPADTQVINRSGRPMEWQTGVVDESVADEIGQTCFDLLERLNYPRPSKAGTQISLQRQINCLAFLRKVCGVEVVAANRRPHAGDAFSRTLKAIAWLDRGQLDRAGLPRHELQQLRSSVREFLARACTAIDACFASAIEPLDALTSPPSLLTRLGGGLSRRVRRFLGYEA